MCKGKVLLGGLVVPIERLAIILLNTIPIRVHTTEAELGLGIPLFRSLAVPLGSFGMALWNSEGTVVCIAWRFAYFTREDAEFSPTWEPFLEQTLDEPGGARYWKIARAQFPPEEAFAVFVDQVLERLRSASGAA